MDKYLLTGIVVAHCLQATIQERQYMTIYRMFVRFFNNRQLSVHVLLHLIHGLFKNHYSVQCVWREIKFSGVQSILFSTSHVYI